MRDEINLLTSFHAIRETLAVMNRSEPGRIARCLHNLEDGARVADTLEFLLFYAAARIHGALIPLP